MYRSLWFTAIALALLCARHARSQGPTPREFPQTAFTMHISLKESRVKPGAVVTVNVELLNATDREVRIASSPYPYAVDVIDHAGKPAPLTPRGRLVLKKERIVEDGKTRIYIGGTSWTIRIPPGGTVNDEVVITDFFVLSQPGEYTIRLRRPDTETRQLVTSNAVTLTVTSDSPPNQTEK